MANNSTAPADKKPTETAKVMVTESNTLTGKKQEEFTSKMQEL